MENAKKASAQALQQLCIDMIDVLNKLRKNGLITDEDYFAHAGMKLQFVEDTKRMNSLK